MPAPAPLRIFEQLHDLSTEPLDRRRPDRPGDVAPVVPVEDRLRPRREEPVEVANRLLDDPDVLIQPVELFQDLVERHRRRRPRGHQTSPSPFCSVRVFRSYPTRFPLS